MTRAIVLHPDLRQASAASPSIALEEAKSLTAAIDLELVDGLVVPVPKPSSATLFGPGKVDELGEIVARSQIDLVVIDGVVSPVQQRNLEKSWKSKILDRTGLILEIFGERAQTREGTLQVELAHLNYQKTRLVRSWTHLERQRGGLGFVGGPGETQIEADRRMIDERISKLRKQLAKVVKTRALHRSARKKVPYPIIALVGYTNAGKSTLFNRLTNADVRAEDLLFATLDPTMRKLELPSGRIAILSDTVGFISDLPTQLVAAFRATLEEVLEADLVVHVRDVAHPQSEQHRQDVLAVIEDLGIDIELPDLFFEAHNKIDLFSDDERNAYVLKASRLEGALAISAQTGLGLEQLLVEIEARLFPQKLLVEFGFGHEDGALISWLYQHSDVSSRADGEAGVLLIAEMTERELSQFTKRFPARKSVLRRLPSLPSS